MVDTYRIAIFAGLTITTLSVCSALGNYFMLKSNLEAEVEERVKQIRKEFYQLGSGGSAAMLQAADGFTVTEQIDNSENFNKIPTEDLVKLISYMNSTLSKNIQNLRNISQALDVRMNTSQQKMKLFEDLVGRNNLAAQKGRPGPTEKAQTGIDSTKTAKENNLKVVSKDEKQTKNRQVSSPAEKHVYFSLALTKTLKDVSANHVIIFDLVYSNEGFGYNIKTGMFIAPVKGTYFLMFFVEVLNVKGKAAHVNLFVDGKEKASARAEAWHDGQDVTSANAVVMHLSKGQKVWLQTAAPLNKMHDIDKRKTTFTGVLLYQ